MANEKPKASDVITPNNDQIEMFLNEFISTIYKGDHILARKYYQELFRKIMPGYFSICNK